MNIDTLKNFIEEGESYKVEFKREFYQKDKNNIVKEMAAFANADGGWIIFGVDDNGKVAGLKETKKFEETIMNLAANNITPPIIPTFYVFTIEEKDVVALEVPKGDNKPYRPFYIRHGTTKREVSLEELRRLYQESGLISFDRSLIDDSSISDLDIEKFEKYLFLTTGKHMNDFPVTRENLLLNKSILGRRSGEYKVTIAGMLVFGKEPQKFVPQSEIACVRFKGLEIGDELIDKKDFQGTLDELIEQSISFIDRNSSVNARIGRTKRIEIPEYQPQVVREFVINAVAHRDYSILGSKIRIFMFDDRLEMISPGNLPNTITLDSLKTGIHYSRNRLVFEFLHSMGYGERIGTGIPRAIKLCNEQGYKEPEIQISENEVKVVLFSKFVA